MSAEYSVEEVREFARSVATYGNAKHTAMLIDLIERIDAGERAVPVPSREEFFNRCSQSFSSEVMDEILELWEAACGYPPAQAAQVAQLWEMKQRACLAHALCNELRLAHPEIPELGDDGVLHEAIHDILRVDTPTAKPAQAVDVGAIRRVIVDMRDSKYFDRNGWIEEWADKLTRAIGNAQAEGWRELEAEARRLYNASVGDAHNLHCLAWSELSKDQQRKWISKASTAPPTQATPNAHE